METSDDQGAPAGEAPREAQRSNLRTVLEVAAVAGAANGVAPDLYRDIKTAGKAAAGKIRDLVTGDHGQESGPDAPAAPPE
jgi:hypothetical protein